MTNEELAALLTKLDGEATPGPVDVFTNDGKDWMVSTLSIPQHPIALCGPNDNNAALIATYRNHHAQIVAGLAALGEVERLRGTLSYLRTQAKNGTLHPQVVIQNINHVLGVEA